MTRKPVHNAVAEAVQAAGTQQRLADVLGVSQQAVSLWLRRGYVPLRRAQEIEVLWGVPRLRLVHPRIADLIECTTADDVF